MTSMREQSREHRPESPKHLQAGAEYQETNGHRTFKLERKLGEGGLGVVYLAKNLSNGMEVAIKFMKPEAQADKEFVDRFNREMIVAGRFTNPFILKTIDRIELNVGGETEVGFVTEYVKGRNLFQELQFSSSQDGIEGRMNPETAVEYVAELAVAIASMGQAGFVHRDVKPENVYLHTLPDGTKMALLGDFGLTNSAKDWKERSKKMTPEENEQAFIEAAHKRVTMQASVIGTPEYMSPDLFADSDVTEKSDVYALGVLCYRLLTGEMPFEFKSYDELKKKVKKSPPRSFEEVDAASVPKELQALVMRMLEKNPANRPDGMEVFETIKAWVKKNHPEKMNNIPFQYDFKRALSSAETPRVQNAA